MKKKFILIQLFLFSIGALANNRMLVRPITFASVPKTYVLPRIDGQLNDPCWQQSRELSGFVQTAGEDFSTPARQATTCLLLYDDTHLYVAFQSREPEISKLKMNSKMWDDADILYDDRVHIFLDIDHDHRSFYELVVNPRGVQFDRKCFTRYEKVHRVDLDASWNCFWLARTKIEEDQWVSEIAIDLPSLGIDQIQEGTTFGFNIARGCLPYDEKGGSWILDYARRPKGDEEEYSAWALMRDNETSSVSNFYSPIEFGDIVFGNIPFEVSEISYLGDHHNSSEPVLHPSVFGRNPLKLCFKTDKKRKAVLHLSVDPLSSERWESKQIINIDSNAPVETDYYIPENGENRLSIQLLDSDTGQQLYVTSYVLTVPPYIEFNLEPLYSYQPSEIRPVLFFLRASKEFYKITKLELTLLEPVSDSVITSQTIEDLSDASDYQPVFDIQKLRQLPGGNYTIQSRLIRKSDDVELSNYKLSFTKFNPVIPSKFQVVEQPYNFGGFSGHAVRIQFSFPAEFVFWKHACYIPWWDLGQIGISYEFVETWGEGNQGCSEPMQDREGRYTRVKILEKSPARVVVQYRYAINDHHYRILRNEWVDEYYTFYPSGIGTRHVDVWPNSTRKHELFEILLAKPPAARAKDFFHNNVAVLSSLDGERRTTNEFYAEPDSFYKDFISRIKEFFIEIELKDRLHPFACFSLREELLPGVNPKYFTLCSPRRKYDLNNDLPRGHWPASLYQIDGYNAVALDVPNHGNLGSIHMDVNPDNLPNSYVILIGLAEPNTNTAQKEAESWLYPGDVQCISNNIEFIKYDYFQRAYLFNAKKALKDCGIKLNPQKDVINPVFLIKDQEQKVRKITINDQELESSCFQSGLSRNNELIVFLNTEIKEKDTLLKLEF